MSDQNPNPDDNDLEDASLSGREKAMGFWDHLEELRSTLIKSIIAFAVFAGAIGIFMTEFNQVLLRPFLKIAAEYPDANLQLGIMSPMESFNIVIQMCLLGGLIMAMPFILFFVGQFVAPALTEKEMKAVVPMCASALVLFIGGACFAFFILIPSTMRVSMQITEMLGFKFQWTAASYYSLLTIMVLGIGASFEFPLLIVLLVWLGVLTTDFLRKYRRHAIVVIFVIAAIATPTPDPLNQTIFAIPLYVLYELAILASSRVEKRKKKNEQL